MRPLSRISLKKLADVGPMEEPPFRCQECRDTHFVLRQDERGRWESKRCLACKSAVDKGIRESDPYNAQLPADAWEIP